MSLDGKETDVKSDPDKRSFLQILGQGMDVGVGMDEMKSPFTIIYSPADKVFDVALLQGSFRVSAVETGMAISWNTLYGYYLDDNHRKFSDLEAIAKKTGDPNYGAWETVPFAMARECFNRILRYLQDAGQTKTEIKQLDGEEIVHIYLAEIETMKDHIFMDLMRTFQNGTLRDNVGRYRWIGLNAVSDVGVTPISTPAYIPRIIEGKKDVELRANVMPTRPDSDEYIYPREDSCQQAVVSGLLHAFEDQTAFADDCSIRAAFLTYIYGGNFSLERMLSSAARVGMYPRLGSTSIDSGWLWQRITAFSLAWEYIKQMYVAEWGQNICGARYIFTGTGQGTSALELLTRSYLCASYAATKNVASTSAGGLFFFPATNRWGSTYQFGFVKYVGEQPSVDKSTRITPGDGFREYINWKTDPLKVGKDGILDLGDEQQFLSEYHPVTVDTTHGVRREWENVGYGLRQAHIVIRDKKHQDNGFKPSDLSKNWMLGWSPAYEAEGLVFRRLPGPANLDEFSHFDVKYSIFGTKKKES